MKCARSMMRLYAVTDRKWVGRQSLYEQVESALKGGATCLQLREKDMRPEDFLAEAVEIKKLCARYKVPFIIDDNVEVALKCGADGVHVGQHDMKAGKVRELVGPDMILGVSAHTPELAVEAERAGADYIGAGTVFPTSTKPDADFVSHGTLKAVCAAVSVPVVAIGGISGANIMKLSGCGLAGVSVVSALFGSPDIEKAGRELLALSDKMIKA